MEQQSLRRLKNYVRFKKQQLINRSDKIKYETVSTYFKFIMMNSSKNADERREEKLKHLKTKMMSVLHNSCSFFVWEKFCFLLSLLFGFDVSNSLFFIYNTCIHCHIWFWPKFLLKFLFWHTHDTKNNCNNNSIQNHNTLCFSLFSVIFPVHRSIIIFFLA